MKYGLVAIAAALTVLGGCKTSTKKEGVTCAELEGLPPLVEGEAEETPPPCNFDSLSESPYLEMPRSEVMETYLSSMSAIGILAIDYMVHPAPRVLGGTSLIESNDNAKPTPLGVSACATEIPNPSTPIRFG